ncbi:MAG: ABC transporter permease [Chloroflexi bacterium]|nr:ABC transporter permease [Chloroflexota bacterium]
MANPAATMGAHKTRGRSHWIVRAPVSFLKFCRAKPLGGISAIIIFSLLVIAIFAPQIAPHEPTRTFVGKPNLSPNGDFWFGTDNLGRDVLSRAIYGARVSMKVGFIAVFFATLIGASIGVLSGYFQGKFDIIVQRLMDAIQAFPSLILALAIVAVRGPSINSALIVITVVLIPGGARIVRGAVLSVKQNVYVEASRALGASNFRIMFRHILPNVMAPIIVNVSILLGGAILFEASLSFLGAGASVEEATWGLMISGNAGTGVNTSIDFQTYPWLALVPAGCISLAVFSFNLLGDAIRDTLDPRLRGGGGRIT